MCIVFFASHTHCAHHHFLGAWNCNLNCPTSARHTFHLQGSEYDCQTYVFLQCDEIDPDVVPVEYYAPLFDVDKLVKDAEEQVKEEMEGRSEVTGKGHRMGDYKALSDPESLTSEWREEPDPISSTEWTALSNTAYATPEHHSAPIRPLGDATAETMSRVAAHRNLVKEQLEKLQLVTETGVFPSQVGEDGYWWNGASAPLARFGRDHGRGRGRRDRGV
jgi:hypothetical protein